MVPNVLELETSTNSLEEPELLGENLLKDHVEYLSEDRDLEKRVNDALDALYQDSQIFSRESPSAHIPHFTWGDILVGDQIGEGGFNSVHSAQLRASKDDVFAIKFIKPKLYEDGYLSRLQQGTVDLVLEGKYLTRLKHPNLVQLKGVSKNDQDKPFLIMCRLKETLTERMEAWKVKEKELEQKYRKESQLQQQRRLQLQTRLQVAMDIARVLKYLHQNHVVYRDLKPENIGFDTEGTVKLFDLGLAKEMKNPQQNGKYKMSGETGSWTYMAPEVAKNWAYDEAVDMYSFGILLWEICALQKPFEGVTDEQFMQDVVSGDIRPPLDKSWPTELQWILKKCWSYFASHRPKWDVVIETLQEVMDDTELEEPEDSVRGFASLRNMSWRNRESNNSTRSSLRAPGNGIRGIGRRESGRFVAGAPRVPTKSPPSPTPQPQRGRHIRTRSEGVRAFGFFKKNAN